MPDEIIIRFDRSEGTVTIASPLGDEIELDRDAAALLSQQLIDALLEMQDD